MLCAVRSHLIRLFPGITSPICQNSAPDRCPELKTLQHVELRARQRRFNRTLDLSWGLSDQLLEEFQLIEQANGELVRD